MDESGDVKPVHLAASSSVCQQESSSGQLNGHSRGTKRSRTPESRLDVESGSEPEESKPRKRRLVQGSRPPSPPPSNGATTSVKHTPLLKAQSLPRDSPAIQPATSATPNKPIGGSIAPLHTTSDQLSEDRSGYVEIEHDPDGEKKVLATGHLTEGRSYRARTFHLPDRDEKLFMLATECAKVLVFRDSYLLFNKNKSLHKIIATQSDKESLIEQKILPFSYRSRQIALVSARSIYRQFGAKMIQDGRRVKDDYWEAHARAQGYTEEDFAIEKKVVAVKVKETPGTDISSVGATAMNTLAQGEIVFQEPPTSDKPPLLGLGLTGDIKLPANIYGGISRPRQDIVGLPYEDRTQPSHGKEIVDQAAQASQFNQACAEGARNRRAFFQDYYLKPREVATPRPATATTTRGPERSPSPRPQRHRPSPMQHRESQSMAPDLRQQQQQHHMPQQQTPSHMMGSQGFARPQHPSMVQASPAQQQHNMVRRESMSSQMSQPQQRPNFPFNQSQGNEQYNAYRQPNGMWPSQQLMSPHHGNQQHHPQQQQQQQHMGGPGPQQSPHPSMHGSPAPMGFPSQSMGGQNMGGVGPGMNGMPPSYPRLPQNMYNAGANPTQNYMQHQQQQQQQMAHNQGMMGQGMGGHQQGFPGMQGHQQQPGLMRQYSGYG